jgi:ssDNA-binding replication factor A large subunit
MKIRELKQGAKKIDMDVVVASAGPVRDFNKDGIPQRAQTIKIEDETGTCNLSLFNENTGRLEAGQKLLIRNAYCPGLDNYDNVMKITLGNFGKMTLDK